ncbi:citrate lyase acyl carrier protein [Candidatus Phytoplasma phoenicium]|uniref:Citrate lyase acyl carrier protein n=1 Tax=Candidatus Phytoplasma phoenicium TaxID=198422 RepID=A0A2S8NUU4_9MOLU|nr:citrate lyase acyl carrier protein [Candidatus Phytoplasma phoenicium]
MTNINNKTPLIIKKRAICGSLESGDVLLTIEPNTDNKLNIIIQSPFIRQFGYRIKQITETTLKDLNILSCNLVIKDQGAIDDVLIARLMTIVQRAT